MVLMVSELATNAVRHAQTDFTVAITYTDSMVEVSVSDRGGGTPLKRDPTHSEPTGRGLLIVDAFSDEWGITRSGKTTAIWFRLAHAKHRHDP
jgi:anti-sigma regulatory factor (Ser/Thr protein kinase)